jgi:hypothetical protein
MYYLHIKHNQKKINLIFKKLHPIHQVLINVFNFLIFILFMPHFAIFLWPCYTFLDVNQNRLDKCKVKTLGNFVICNSYGPTLDNACPKHVLSNSSNMPKALQDTIEFKANVHVCKLDPSSFTYARIDFELG